MNFSLGGFLSLRPFILVGLIVLWNLLMALAIYLNGGAGKLKSSETAYVLGIACFITSLFCFSVLFRGTVRKIVIRPGHLESFDRTPFFFTGAISLLLGAVVFLQAAGVLGFALPLKKS